MKTSKEILEIGANGIARARKMVWPIATERTTIDLKLEDLFSAKYHLLNRHLFCQTYFQATLLEAVNLARHLRLFFALAPRLVDSPFGKVLEATRDNELATRVLGKNTFKIKSIDPTFSTNLVVPSIFFI